MTFKILKIAVYFSTIAGIIPCLWEAVFWVKIATIFAHLLNYNIDPLIPIIFRNPGTVSTIPPTRHSNPTGPSFCSQHFHPFIHSSFLFAHLTHSLTLFSTARAPCYKPPAQSEMIWSNVRSHVALTSYVLKAILIPNIEHESVLWNSSWNVFRPCSIL
jgi:hypothetical protein